MRTSWPMRLFVAGLFASLALIALVLRVSLDDQSHGLRHHRRHLGTVKRDLRGSVDNSELAEEFNVSDYAPIQLFPLHNDTLPDVQVAQVPPVASVDSSTSSSLAEAQPDLQRPPQEPPQHEELEYLPIHLLNYSVPEAIHLPALHYDGAEESPLLVEAREAIDHGLASLEAPLAQIYAPLSLKAKSFSPATSSLFPQLESFYSSFIDLSMKTLQQEQLLQQSQSHALFSTDPVLQFHLALRNGSLCPLPLPHSSTLSLTAAVFEYMSRKKVTVLFEIGSLQAENSISFALAHQNPTMTFVYQQLTNPSSLSDDDTLKDDELANSNRIQSSYLSEAQKKCEDPARPSNLFISNRESVLHSQRHFQCIQVIPDLSAMAGDRLHFEFEEFLGDALCRCQYTFLPRDLPTSSFFSYWDSVVTLAKVSANSSSFPNCQMSSDYSESFSSFSSFKYSNILMKRSFVETGAVAANQTETPLQVNDLLSFQLTPHSLHQLHSSIVSYTSLYAPAILDLIKENLGEADPLISSFRNQSKFLRYMLDNLSVVGSAVIFFNANFSNKFIRDPRQLVGLNLDLAEEVPQNLVPSQSSSTGITSSSDSHSNLSSMLNSSSNSSLFTTSLNSTIISESLSSNVSNATTPFASSNRTSRRLSATYFGSSSTSSSASSSILTSLMNPDTNYGLATFQTDSWEIKDQNTIGDHFLFGFENEQGLNDLIRLRSNVSFESSSSKQKPFLDGLSRSQYRDLQSREVNTFKRWMMTLKSDGEFFGLAKQANFVLIIGREISLLSSKICLTMKKKSGVAREVGLVVSTVTDFLAIDPHLRLLASKKIKNNILCHSRLTLPKLAALAASPERADIAILQADVIINLMVETFSQISPVAGTSSFDPNLVCFVSLFEESLANLLLMATQLYVELPSAAQFSFILESIQFNYCRDYLIERYLSSSNMEALVSQVLLRAPAGAYLEIDDLEGLRSESSIESGPPMRSSILRIKWTFDPIEPNSVENSPQVESKFSQKSSFFGVSLYTLVHLGVSRIQMRQLFLLLVDMPLWNLSDEERMDVYPWSIFVRMSSEHKSLKLSMWQINSRVLHQVVSEFQSQSLSLSRLPAASRQQLKTRLSNDMIGNSAGADGLTQDKLRATILWDAISHDLESKPTELCNGRFSFVEHNSGFGYFSAKIAMTFPNATIISVERDSKKVEFHEDLLFTLGVQNNAICQKTATDDEIFKNLYESPEFFRYQLVSRGLLESFMNSKDLDSWGQRMGELLSTALSSFIVVPLADQVSMAMKTMFGGIVGTGVLSGGFGPFRPLHGGDAAGDSSIYNINNHPSFEFRDFEALWLFKNTKVKGSTQLSVAPLTVQKASNDLASQNSRYNQQIRPDSHLLRVPLVRCDVINMTRHVHHHYDYAKDGHSRTYLMRIQANQTLTNEVSREYFTNQVDFSSLSVRQEPDALVLLKEPHSAQMSSNSSMGAAEVKLPAGVHPNQHKLVHVGIEREKDHFFIPYTSIYGITLITVLRMGLLPKQRDHLFNKFLRLPLYEDMAPWNIVLMGPSVDYIDYDTRDFSFDGDVPKAYQIMAVLMNYKRSVEDFKKCEAKASTVYGLPFVSDCVGKVPDGLKCPEMKLPVPCGDGQCHSDYISCLRALSSMAEQAIIGMPTQELGTSSEQRVWTFNTNGLIRGA